MHYLYLSLCNIAISTLIDVTALANKSPLSDHKEKGNIGRGWDLRGAHRAKTLMNAEI